VSGDQLPSEASVVLGHRRLSIVDLVTGDQPMSNEDGSVWIAFNGEIYNHLELRRTLEAAGHRFGTRADTEVLLHGWEEWGEELLPRLNGIFAFALTDRRRGVTVLARDPVGVKSLYVGVQDGLTWWASELGAARGTGLASGAVSPEALKLYLMFRFIPSPSAVFEGTWKLPPGYCVLLRPADAGRAPVFRSYRTAVRSSAAPQGRMEWREALMVELESAVTHQLMSDVPVGTLLSGGVDSSMITMLMDRHLPYHPQAFGIGFRSHGEASETHAAQWAAGALGVPFTPTWVDDDQYLAAWPEAFAQVGEPIGNSGGLLVHWLCRTVAGTHKVVLSGQGADEPLGGYPRHMVERLRRLGRLAPRASGWVAERLLGAGAGRRLQRVLGATNRIDRYLEIFAVLRPEVVDALIPAGAPSRELGRAAIGRWVADEETGDDLNDLLRADARLSLADDLLVIADHFSMRASVELRVPFLDLQFLELVERMPSRYKVSRIGERKWLYRQGAARSLPPALARKLGGLGERIGRKRGFTTPLERWLSTSGGPLAAPQRWMEPLIARGLLTRSAMSTFAADAEGRGGAMQRELLAVYSLSQWVAALGA
jgi:asparagine synthase (glutamine-hydrolysing)